MIRPARSNALLALAAAIALFRFVPAVAVAHGGHAHDEGGFRIDGIVDVVLTVGVMVIAYILATWFLRHRDHRAGSPAGPDDAP